MSDSDNHSTTNSASESFSSWQGDTAHMPPPPMEEQSAQRTTDEDDTGSPNEASDSAEGREEPDKPHVIGTVPADAPPVPNDATTTDETPCPDGPDPAATGTDTGKTQVIDSMPNADDAANSASISFTLSKKTLAIAAAVIAVLVVAGISLSSALEAPTTRASNSSSSASEDDAENDASEPASRPSANDGVSGSYVEIIGDALYWGRDNELWTASIDEDGLVDEMEPLTVFDEDISLIAKDGRMLFVCCDDGIWRIDTDEEQEDPERIIRADSIDDFWLTGTGIGYLSDDELFHTDYQGDEEQRLASGISHFGATNGLVYAVSESGELTEINTATGDEEAIDEVNEETELVAFGATMYLACEGEELRYVSGNALEDLGLKHPLGDPSKLLILPDDVYYEGASGDDYRFDDSGEDENLGTVIFRGKPMSRMKDGYLYYTIDGDEITVVDLENDFEYETFDVDDADSDDDDAASASSASSSSNSSSRSDSSTTNDPDEATPDRPFVGSTTEDIYDIAESIEMHSTGGTTVLTTSHFTLPLGATSGMGGEWTVYPNSTLTIEFYCTAARDSGHNGLVFTLAAYDWNDNSYSDIPTAQVAGVSEDKKFVVWMPTDLQYDSSNSTQKRLYQEMRSFAESLDMNSNPDGNPFTVLDQ